MMPRRIILESTPNDRAAKAHLINPRILLARRGVQL
jgi:hypothetical protein